MAKKYGFELLMWGDMFFRLAGGDYFTNFNQDPELGEIPEKIKQLVPENVQLVYWDYFSREQQRYEKNIDAHNAIKSESWFAGGLWTWAGFAPHNAFAIATMREAMRACRARSRTSPTGMTPRRTASRRCWTRRLPSKASHPFFCPTIWTNREIGGQYWLRQKKLYEGKHYVICQLELRQENPVAKRFLRNLYRLGTK